jgi:nucleoside-diphosphate-sugar epimerase
MTSVLVTGAAGLIGRTLIKLCLAHDWTVYALCRRARPNCGTLVKDITLDLSTGFDLSLFPKRIDSVVHLAQSNHYRDFPTHANDLYGVNVISTSRLLDYAYSAGASQFIYASTGGLYIPSSGYLSENAAIHSPGKLGAYYASKICGELLVQTYSSYFAATILRPFFAYGPGQKASMLIPRLLANVRSGKPIQLQGECGLALNPIHCLDAANAIVSSIKNPSSAVINIAGPEVLTIREMATLSAMHFDVQPVFEQLSGEPQSLIADTSLMESALCAPVIKFSDSISELSP